MFFISRIALQLKLGDDAFGNYTQLEVQWAYSGV